MINSFLSIAVEINLLKVKELLPPNILSLKCQNRAAQPAGFKRARELGGFFPFAMKAIVFAVSPLHYSDSNSAQASRMHPIQVAQRIVYSLVWYGRLFRLRP